MSMRVGIDLVGTEEVAAAVADHGDRYLRRIYTRHEREDCASDPQRLAARFAAKEATMKALGRGDEPLPWQSIGVRRDAEGRPSLELSGAAAALAHERSVSAMSLSLTHEGSLAAAVVLVEVNR
jgi:holo-[acyl-carrier protein] synthase